MKTRPCSYSARREANGYYRNDAMQLVQDMRNKASEEDKAKVCLRLSILVLIYCFVLGMFLCHTFSNSFAYISSCSFSRSVNTSLSSNPISSLARSHWLPLHWRVFCCWDTNKVAVLLACCQLTSSPKLRRKSSLFRLQR
jgi:hypothetical protein